MNEKLGFIGGGQMAEALIRGIMTADLYTADQISLCEPNTTRATHMADTYGIQITDTFGLWKTCNKVILAVKPQVMEQVLKAAHPHCSASHLVITIAAGIPMSTYEDFLFPELKLIRVMPNTPCLILEGASALSCNVNVNTTEMAQAVDIFEAVGKAIVLDESYLDAVTGLSGSGPAYIFNFIEGFFDAGVKVGLPRQAAELLTMQTLIGSIRLLEEQKLHPALLKAQVSSPGGTSITGLHVMEKEGFRAIIMDAVEAATNRSKELGKK